MQARALVLALACAAAAIPAAAQLRPVPQLGGGRAPAPAAPRAADYIVAVVNSEPITNNEFRTRLFRFEQQLAQQGGALPPREELTRVVLERLISEKAQLQLAREYGYRAEEATIDAAEQSFARQNGLEVPQLRQRLQAEGVALPAFREDLRNQILLNRLREREVDNKVRVSELDIEQYLREQQAANDPSALELNLAHVLVALPDNPSEQQLRDARAKADRALQRARAGEDFAKVAAEMSEAAGAAANGGALGMRPADRLPPAFLDAARTLQVGEVADVFPTGAGFHVVKVLDRRQGGLPTTVTQQHARHILLRAGGQLTEAAALARLADFKRRIQAGQADFAQLARENSQDASAPSGGDLGWAMPGTFVPEFEDVLQRLAPGQIADPVVTRFGAHLVQLLERRTTRLSPREQREIARNLIRDKKLDEAYARWVEEVRGRAFVELRDPPT